MKQDAITECPWCDTRLTIPAELAGKPVTCAACAGEFLADIPAVPERKRSKKTCRPAVPGGGSTNPTPDEFSSRNLILLGIAALLLSVIPGYWAVYEPLEAMRRHVPTASWTGKVRFLFVFLAVNGSAAILWGIFVAPFRSRKTVTNSFSAPDVSTGGKLILGLSCAASIVLSLRLDEWFDGQIEALGYNKADRMAKYAPPPAAPAVPGKDTWREMDRLWRKGGPGDALEKMLEDQSRKSRENIKFWENLEKQFKEKRTTRP